MIPAGLSLKDVAGSRTSVHVGCFSSDYQGIQSRDPLNVPKYGATGASSCILSNRISWFFDLHGPSMTIDTACSSSMVAFDLGCQGIWNGSVDAVSDSHLLLKSSGNEAVWTYSLCRV